MRAALGERAFIVPISYIMPPDLLPDPRTRVRARATAEALTRANVHQRHRPVAFTDLCSSGPSATLLGCTRCGDRSGLLTAAQRSKHVGTYRSAVARECRWTLES